jgi:predicted site-specific integrase-resolvase
VDEWVQEIGCGMTLARFGYDYLHHEAETAGCEIVVANQESLSPQQEMVQDLLAIVRVFSRRLYGLRRYEKQLTSADLGGEPC